MIRRYNNFSLNFVLEGLQLRRGGGITMKRERAFLILLVRIRGAALAFIRIRSRRDNRGIWTSSGRVIKEAGVVLMWIYILIEELIVER